MQPLSYTPSPGSGDNTLGRSWIPAWLPRTSVCLPPLSRSPAMVHISDTQQARMMARSQKLGWEKTPFNIFLSNKTLYWFLFLRPLYLSVLGEVNHKTEAPGAVRIEYSTEAWTRRSLRSFPTLTSSDSVKADPIMVKRLQDHPLHARHLTAALSSDPCEESVNIPTLQMRKPRLQEAVAQDHTEAELGFEFGSF